MTKANHDRGMVTDGQVGRFGSERRILWADGRRCAGAYFMISQAEIQMAIRARLPGSAWILWNYVGIKVSGNPDGWRIGIKELERATGLSPPTLWRAAKQLDAAGLVHKKRDGVNRWVLCDGTCDACRAPKTPVEK